MHSLVRVIAAAAIILASTDSMAGPWGEVDGRWLDLWTRCRVALEEGRPIDSSGLESLGTGRDSLGRQAETWRDPGSIFEVRDSLWDGGGRECSVSISEGHWPENPGDLVAIIGTFEEERRTLIEAGSHEWRALDRVGDYAAAVAPSEHNKNGCPLISGLIIFVRDQSFISMTGEQVADPCSENYPAKRAAAPTP